VIFLCSKFHKNPSKTLGRQIIFQRNGKVWGPELLWKWTGLPLYLNFSFTNFHQITSKRLGGVAGEDKGADPGIFFQVVVVCVVVVGGGSAPVKGNYTMIFLGGTPQIPEGGVCVCVRNPLLSRYVHGQTHSLPSFPCASRKIPLSTSHGFTRIL
jgi:hypothetical protein